MRANICRNCKILFYKVAMCYFHGKLVSTWNTGKVMHGKRVQWDRGKLRGNSPFLKLHLLPPFCKMLRLNKLKRGTAVSNEGHRHNYTIANLCAPEAFIQRWERRVTSRKHVNQSFHRRCFYLECTKIENAPGKVATLDRSFLSSKFFTLYLNIVCVRNISCIKNNICKLANFYESPTNVHLEKEIERNGKFCNKRWVLILTRSCFTHLCRTNIINNSLHYIRRSFLTRGRREIPFHDMTHLVKGSH